MNIFAIQVLKPDIIVNLNFQPRHGSKKKDIGICLQINTSNLVFAINWDISCQRLFCRCTHQITKCSLQVITPFGRLTLCTLAVAVQVGENNQQWRGGHRADGPGSDPPASWPAPPTPSGTGPCSPPEACRCALEQRETNGQQSSGTWSDT